MSNQSENLDQSCEECSQLIPELALGCLDGRERAAALGHIRRCARCRREFAEYRDLADDLLDLVPAATPPAGFEVRVLAAMKAPQPGIPQANSRRRRGRLLAGAAAAAAVVALIAATLFGGYEIGRPGASEIGRPGTSEIGRPGTSKIGRPAASIPPLLTVALMSGGQQVGAAYFYTGPRPFFWVNVWAAGDRVKNVTCKLRPASGRKAVTIGTFPLSRGRGSWGSLIPHRTGSATFIFSGKRQKIGTSTVRI